jgi:hypothetical protein
VRQQAQGRSRGEQAPHSRSPLLCARFPIHAS